MPEEITSSLAEVASEILALLGHDPRAAGAQGGVSIEALRKCTREQLIEYARRSGTDRCGQAEQRSPRGTHSERSRSISSRASERRRRRSDRRRYSPRGIDREWARAVPGEVRPRPRFAGGADPAPHPLELRPESRDRDGRRSRQDVRVLGVHRRRHRRREARSRRGGARRLAQPARLRRHRAPVRRHQRAQLLRSQGRSFGPPVVLRHWQADVGGLRGAGPEIDRGLLRQDLPLGTRRVPASRAGGLEPRRMAHGRLVERRRRPAGARRSAVVVVAAAAAAARSVAAPRVSAGCMASPTGPTAAGAAASGRARRSVRTCSSAAGSGARRWAAA